MSERELRQASKRLFYACTTQSQRAVEAMVDVNKALADEPDVVDVLKELRGRRKWALAVEATGRESGDVNTEVAGMISAREDERLAEWVSMHFRIRLTDGGYEYTEPSE